MVRVRVSDNTSRATTVDGGKWDDVSKMRLALNFWGIAVAHADIRSVRDTAPG